MNAFPSSNEHISVLPFYILKEGKHVDMFINIHEVIRVDPFQNISDLPNRIGPFRYLYNFEGSPIPVIELSQEIFGNPSLQQMELKRLIILQLMGRSFAILIDGTHKVRRLLSKDILPPPEWIQFDGTSIGGVLNDNGHYLYMFDPEPMLETHGISMSRNPLKETSQAMKATLSGKRIPVAEDSRIFQKLVSTALTQMDASFDLVPDGVKGLELLLSKKYDLVVTDIEMPLMNGIEMARSFLASGGHVPIIFHSSISNPHLIRELEQENLGRFLEKFDETSLINELIRTLSIS